MDTPVALDVIALRVAMARAGVRSIARLSRRANISDSYGRTVSRGAIPSEAVRERIARVLRVDASTIWRPLPEVAADAQTAPAGGRR